MSKNWEELITSDAFKQLQEVSRDILKIQGSDGNWNYDPYMHGMFNGMEFFVSMLECRPPEFREAPEVWLEDRHNDFKHKETTNSINY
jgi:hypothetical protein